MIEIAIELGNKLRLLDPDRDLLRELAQALGLLVRRHGQFAACEDAVQEA